MDTQTIDSNKKIILAEVRSLLFLFDRAYFVGNASIELFSHGNSEDHFNGRLRKVLNVIAANNFDVLEYRIEVTEFGTTVASFDVRPRFCNPCMITNNRYFRTAA